MRHDSMDGPKNGPRDAVYSDMPAGLTLTTCTVDLARQRVERDGQRTALTSQEAALLDYLSVRAGQTVTRDALFTEVLGYADGTRSRALDAAIRRIRNKIEADPGAPDHLLTVHGEGYRLTLPVPDRPAAAALPTYPDLFVGRAELVDALTAALTEPSLVTLHGPGGAGKTRLACEALRGRDATLVSARPGADAPSLAADVAAALGLHPADDAIAPTALALAARGTVLVIDSAEIAVDGVADLVTRLRATADDLTIVTTSREPLAVPAERVIRVPPLDPDRAVALLRQRAEAAIGGGPWPGAGDEVLAAIVTALDGLPLALELAASRARILSAPALLERLDDRFSILRRTRRGGPSHHATLQATLEWSWDLLSADERAALVQLSVLEGGFEFDAAEAITEVAAPAEPLDVVTRLVDKCLLRPVDAAGQLRMLDSVRAFARDQGAAEPWATLVSGALDRLAAAAHRLPLDPVDRIAGARLALAEQLPSAPYAAIAAIEACADLRDGVALADLAQHHLSGDARIELAVTVRTVLARAAPADILDDWLDWLASTEPDDPALIGPWHGAIGELLLARGHFEHAIQRLEHAVEHSEPDDAHHAQLPLGIALLRRGEAPRAREVLGNARTNLPAGSRPWARATMLYALAVRETEGDLDQSVALLRTAHRALEALGQEREAAACLSNLAAAAFRRSHIREAIELSAEASGILLRRGDLRAGTQADLNTAVLQDKVGDVEASIPGLERVRERFERLGDRAGAALACGNLALRHSIDGDRERSTELIHHAQAEAAAVGARPLTVLLTMFEARIHHYTGDPVAEAAAAERALDLLPPEVDPELETEVRLTRAVAHARTDPESAQADLDRSKHLLDRMARRGLLVAFWELGMASLAAARSDTAEGHRHLAAGIRCLDQLQIGPRGHLRNLAPALEAALGPAPQSSSNSSSTD